MRSAVFPSISAGLVVFVNAFRVSISYAMETRFVLVMVIRSTENKLRFAPDYDLVQRKAGRPRCVEKPFQIRSGRGPAIPRRTR